MEELFQTAGAVHKLDPRNGRTVRKQLAATQKG